MSSFDLELRSFAKELFKINAIKFGEYKTKIGISTPVYFDLRVIVSYPKLLETLATLLNKFFYDINTFDVLCGVPYTALPIATVLSLKTNVPMIMRRKESKSYGTKKIIEGVYKEGSRCLIIEDVVTSGSSILETVKDLNEVGIKCSDALVLLNREQGGNEILKNNGIKMHALFTLTKLMEYLRAEDCIDNNVLQKVQDYLSITKVTTSSTNMETDRLRLTLQKRMKLAKSAVGIKLMDIMSTKQTNLCLAADLTNATDLLNLAEQVGPHICILKTHIDIIDDYHSNMIQPLKEIAERHNFLLLEDRKFSDIGKTVEYQYSKGIFQISSWANLVTVHSLMGKGVLDAIKASEGMKERGVFLLAQASSAGNLITEDYIQNTLKMSEEYPELVTGIVCQSPLFRNSPGILQLTPGVQISVKQDNLGQQYSTPEHTITQLGADIAVVGRGITQAANRQAVAAKYQEILWKAYVDRCDNN